MAKVIFVDEGEWDQLDRINLDLTVAHAVPTARFNLGTPPQTERQRNVTRQDGGPKFPAELPGRPMLRPDSQAPTPLPGAHRYGVHTDC